MQEGGGGDVLTDVADLGKLDLHNLHMGRKLIEHFECKKNMLGNEKK